MQADIRLSKPSPEKQTEDLASANRGLAGARPSTSILNRFGTMILRGSRGSPLIKAMLDPRSSA